MIQVGNRAIAHAGKHIVALVGSAHGLKHRLIGWIIARCTHQRGHGTTGTGSVGNDFLSITRHHTVEMAQIAYCCLEVEYGSGSAARVDGLPLLDAFFLVLLVGDDRRIAAPRARDYQYIPLLEGTPTCIASLRLTCGRGHVPANIGAQENGCLLCCAIWHIDVQELIGRVLNVGHKIEALIGRISYSGAIVHGHHSCFACIRIEL